MDIEALDLLQGVMRRMRGIGAAAMMSAEGDERSSDPASDACRLAADVLYHDVGALERVYDLIEQMSAAETGAADIQS